MVLVTTGSPDESRELSVGRVLKSIWAAIHGSSDGPGTADAAKHLSNPSPPAVVAGRKPCVFLRILYRHDAVRRCDCHSPIKKSCVQHVWSFTMV